MAKVITVKFASHPAERRVEQIVQLDELTDAELVRLLVEVVDEVKGRAPLLRGHSQLDHQGRLWAMSAIMRAVQWKIDMIHNLVGKGLVK